MLAAAGDEIALLTRVFREGAVVNVTGSLRAREQRRPAEPSEPPEVLAEGAPGVEILASPRGQSVFWLRRFAHEFAPERLDLAVPVVARVRDDALNPEPDWRRVRKDGAFLELVRRVEEQAREWVLAGAAPRNYLLGLTRKLTEGRHRAGGLVEALRHLPFWRDTRDRPVCLADLKEQPNLFLSRPTQEEVLLLIEPRVTLVPSEEAADFRALAYPAVDFSRGLRETAHFFREAPGARLPSEGEAWLEEEGLRILKEPGPSRVILAWHGRRLGDLEFRLPFAFQAVVEQGEVLPASRRGGFSDRRLAEQVAAGAVDRAVQACCRLASGPQDPELRLFLAGLLGRLERRPSEPTRPLLNALLKSPLFESVAGERLTLDRLRAAAGELPTVVGDLEPFPRELRRRAASRLGGLALHLVFPLPPDLGLTVRDVTEEFLEDCRALANQDRPPLDSLALEAHYPDQPWLARLRLEHDGYLMEGGLCARPGAPRELMLVIEGVLLARLRSPVPGLSAVLQGPFRANRSWSGLEDPSLADRLALRLADALLESVARRLPSLEQADFVRHRTELLQLFDWRALVGRSDFLLHGFERRLLRLRLFPLTDGRYAALLDLARQVRAHRRLVYSSSRAPAEAELVLLLDAGDPLLGELQQWTPELVERRRPPDPPPDRRQALREALRTQFMLLHPERLSTFERALADLAFGTTPEGTFCFCLPGGQRPVLDPEAPLVRRVLQGEPFAPADLLMLASALFSIINRAAPRVTDRHEREFHERLLTVLGAAQFTSC